MSSDDESSDSENDLYVEMNLSEENMNKIKNGEIDVNKLNSVRYSFLSYMISNQKLKFLIEHGIDVNIVDKRVKYTALMMIITRNNRSEIDNLITLLENGADPYIKNYNGNDVFSTLKNDKKFYIEELKDMKTTDRWYDNNVKGLKTNEIYSIVLNNHITKKQTLFMLLLPLLDDIQTNKKSRVY